MPLTIPKADYLQGLKLCRKNARRLLKLAVEAHDRGCHHAAFLLGYSSWEEVGKAMVIMNHWSDSHIKYNEYRDELRNHKLKTELALKMFLENWVEVYARTPREPLENEIARAHVDENIDQMLSVRTRSLYVDYDFLNQDWIKPLEKMDELAIDVIVKARDSISLFGNELKHRGIRLRKARSRGE